MKSNRFFIEFAYNGTNYHGWQRQPDAITVQEKLEEGMQLLLRESISLVGAGRTDAGVHAKQMFAHFELDDPIKLDNIVYKLNRWLPDDISVFTVVNVNETAHARFDATARSYEYHFHLRPDPFFNHNSHILYRLPNFNKMNKAAQLLLEYNDFECFSRSNSDVHTYLCDLMNVSFEHQKYHVIFHIKANRFLRNMVRAIVGTLLEIGYDKMSVDHLHEVLKSKNRSMAGPSAPAQGLYLSRVHYPDHIFKIED